MDAETKRRYLRLIYARALHYLGGALVLAAIVAGLYHSRVYFVFACCAFGFAFFCWAWFSYMRLTGLRMFGFHPDRDTKRVPYVHRRFKERRPHRPSFAMGNAEFDDDLVRATSADEELFSERQSVLARVWARVVCGALLVFVSLAVYFF
ncbi:MAG: hypothetical protein VB086_04695 [Clostridiaceae bacterium]|nr:hypothetical protein [Clostridiaceae bacterium]